MNESQDKKLEIMDCVCGEKAYITKIMYDHWEVYCNRTACRFNNGVIKGCPEKAIISWNELQNLLRQNNEN